MAIISQINIFDNTEKFDKLGDLERVKIVIENIPDDEILAKLRKDKDYRGRKGTGLEVLINIYWTQKVLQHTTISETLRELRRNSQLRKLIGIRNEIVPSNSALTRFMNKLKKNNIDLKEMIFYPQRDVLMELLPDYGIEDGADGKYLDSYAVRENKNKKKDGRRDTDAKYGIKEKYYKDKNGKEKIKEEIHYGYRNHLLADVNYELPIDYEVTTANINEGKILDQMLKKRSNKTIINKCKSLTADKGYDSEKRIKALEKMGILPIIDKRVKVQGEKEILRTVYYDDKGNVNCYCPIEGTKRPMAFNGYDKRRDTLSYKCPAKAYGIKCKGCETGNCPVNTTIRIRRGINPRVFTQVARNSYKWKRYYNKRTALERINSRMDVGYKFEKHTIRGLAKMKICVDMTMIIMLTIAIENIKLGKLDKIRSLVKCA
jgi:hypothetical protein